MLHRLANSPCKLTGRQDSAPASVQDALHAHILEGLPWPSGQKLNSVAPLLLYTLMSLCTCPHRVAKVLSTAIMHVLALVLLDGAVLHL